MPESLLRSDVPGVVCRRGKVRDVYDVGERLIIVASDRISAFDWVMPTGIPGKGRLLTAMTKFWFNLLGVPNHFLSDDLNAMPAEFQQQALEGRTMMVTKTNVVPIECVARGFLAGSGWKEYRKYGTVCGVRLPQGLREAGRLPEPIFTPATKAETGHDENISFERMADEVGMDLANTLKDRTLEIYRRAARHAESKGIILADTKLEWGLMPDGTVILIDEVLTPDSSRFWPVDGYAAGRSQASFDKQFVRDYLLTLDWDKTPPAPALPPEIVARTQSKYFEAYERLTGKTLG